ncbi:2-C-methyl-D-erythritol 2,4-cyclodiphosphate synthase, chloroplastic [Selaginella moellendorffii]|uniref:2-C-methyl-D-erythritol 2,4-cyclodiphosphate synthase, chloroplastic n=1 Tax=Selaginella moellendorffii TaxID=88036 RepID=UPI000D1C54FD|nr:2-C-methyl-D-erythritol 2,4-cyclodiphosphate synthase, chloroplastic [Selaginella moellendorffii]|eukprot:XP_002989977.2 2-C-methyl-D-erythritol 2,4-cyclodiphosphate synthase, chloroplastic [Selaginella moellendorffii]
MATMMQQGTSLAAASSLFQHKEIRPAPCGPSRVELSRRVSRAARGTICCASTTTVEVETGRTASISAPVLPFRVGHGFDLHRLEPGLPLTIGGIDIPHDRGCEAHSDGDVLLHCVVDAILGALSLPDIGQLFPDTDPRWRGAASSVFVKEAVKRMHEAGYELGNLDATLILQRPKLSPHKEEIRANLCSLLGVHPSVINIKAKTHEKVDSLGENRSIAAHTVVLLMRR